ncbi:hypothetical protein C4N20_03610 [Fusobacterium ulcerans]|uniref:Lipoprotein n=1 Tax=Fusobacterium ulcerans TaxID=861 RepID=A0AAX2JF56_9FUSO|nr:hypothetical protein [Fusobacterium ulcerans]AVQ27216.1 hypothetical protein C4N20_03610 [Fusobacterium ulcerans]EFS24652.2 hypothetical protein FUAG_00167 [Fusobacterium ulcerans ATCC 49185]SQJ11152.1 Uncharacterised protein [Fusobacterium ulcerans]
MKVRYLISLLIIILVIGCTSIKSSHEISLDKIEGRKTLIVNYDRSEIQSVEINRIFLDSGVPYYVELGEYRLKYIETPMVRGIMDFSFRRGKGDRDSESGRSHLERNMAMTKIINVQEDTVVDLVGNKFEISVGGRINSKKSF